MTYLFYPSKDVEPSSEAHLTTNIIGNDSIVSNSITPKSKEKTAPITIATKLISDHIVTPDTVISYDTDKFIAFIHEGSGFEQGLYNVTLNPNGYNRFSGGAFKIIQETQDSTNNRFIMLKSIDFSNGREITAYSRILIKSNTKEKFEYTYITSYRTIPDSSKSKVQRNVKDIVITKEEMVNSYTIKDVDSDTHTDVIFNVTSKDIATQIITNRVDTFLYTDGAYEKLYGITNSDINRFQIIDSIDSLQSSIDNSAFSQNSDSKVISLDPFMKWISSTPKTPTKKRFVEVDECSGDSIFLIEYDNKLLAEYGITTRYYLCEDSPTTALGVKVGFSKNEVEKILGTPFKSHTNLYIYESTVEFEGIPEKYNAIEIYFKDDRAYCIKISIPGTC